MELTLFNQEDLESTEKPFRTNLINSLTGFKSTSLVGTVSASGILNLAVFSQVFHLGANPSLTGIIVRPEARPRHTLENLVSGGYFTLNHIRKEFVKQAHQCAAHYEREVSEFEVVGLTPTFSKRHNAPYVEESRVRIGLKFVERHDLKINNTVMIIGQIIEIQFPEECLQTDGFLDLEEAGSLTGSGLDSYHVTERIARYSYAKPNKPLEEIDE